MITLDEEAIQEPGNVLGVSFRGGDREAVAYEFSKGGLSDGGGAWRNFVRYTLNPQQNEKAQPIFTDWAFKISVEESTGEIEVYLVRGQFTYYSALD